MQQGDAVKRRKKPFIAVETAQRRYPHGSRARYVLGRCRCFACRVANTNYVTSMAASSRPPFRVRHGTGGSWGVFAVATGERIFQTRDRARAYAERDRLNASHAAPADPHTLVSTRAVRAHLKRLKAAGVGLRTVSSMSGVSRSVLVRIAHGAIKRTRRQTEAKLLAVQADAASPLVDASATWTLLDRLISLGYARARIARNLGLGQKLQISRTRIRRSTATRVERLYDAVWRVHPGLRRLDPQGLHGAPKPSLLDRLSLDEMGTRLSRLLRSA
jgi:hypothetical protein